MPGEPLQVDVVGEDFTDRRWQSSSLAFAPDIGADVSGLEHAPAALGWFARGRVVAVEAQMGDAGSGQSGADVDGAGAPGTGVALGSGFAGVRAGIVRPPDDGFHARIGACALAQGITAIDHPILTDDATSTVAQLEQNDVGHRRRFEKLPAQKPFVDALGHVAERFVTQAQR